MLHHFPSHTSQPLTPLLLDTAELLAKRLDAELKRQHGIGLSQYRVLRVLAEKQRITQKSIASALDQTEASISRQMDVLQDDRLVTVHKNPEDRRERIVVLAPRGRDVLHDAETTIETISAAVLPAVHAEPFAELLQRIKDQLSAAD